MASSSLSPTLPVTPSSMTSGIDPQRNASTGVPHAMASIITRPNGSGQSTGNNRASASPRNFVFSRSLISPTNSTGAPLLAVGRAHSQQLTISTHIIFGDEDYFRSEILPL